MTLCKLVRLDVCACEHGTHMAEHRSGRGLKMGCACNKVLGFPGGGNHRTSPNPTWENACLCQQNMAAFMRGGGQDIRASQPVWAPPAFHLFNLPQCMCHHSSHKKVLVPAREPQRYPREPCREQGCPDMSVCPKLSYIYRNVQG